MVERRRPPGGLSYQRHSRRSEHWFVVKGRGGITIEGIAFDISVGEAVDIPLAAAHRAANEQHEPFVFIEVQQGDYCEEDDIIRIQDDFGRPLNQIQNGFHS